MSLRYRSLMVLAAVLFGQLLLMAYQLRRNRDIPLVRGSVVYVVGPFQRVANAAVRGVRGVWDGYVYLWATHRQNQSLQGKLEALTVENQRLREQAAEGQRLQALFDLRQQVPIPTLAAQVLSTGSSETARIVLIDKGANAGLKPDFPVMVYDGVVGKVLHVFPNTSQVLVLTDPYSGVACLLEGSRAHGILKGLNRPLASLAYVPNGEDVKAGQRVLTSGEDQIYPKGLPVGVVVDARPGPEFMQVTVQPLAPLNRLEDVLVILRSGGDVSGSPIASRNAPAANAAPSAPHPALAQAGAATSVGQTAASPSPTASTSAPAASKTPGAVASGAGSAPAQTGIAALPAPPGTASPASKPATPAVAQPSSAVYPQPSRVSSPPAPSSAPNSSGATQAPSSAPPTQQSAPKPPAPKPDASAQPAAPSTPLASPQASPQAATPPRPSPAAPLSSPSPAPAVPSPKPAALPNGITQTPAVP